MDSLDKPSSLTFKSGNTLPPNFKVIAFVALGFAVIMTLTGFLYLGIAILLLDTFVLTQQQIVEINEEKNYVHDFSLHLGFIKLGKKYPLDKYLYVTAMPLLESARVYGRSSNSTTISNNYHSVTMFGNRFRGKRVLKKYDTKVEASEAAEKLADRLELKYFDYDPKLVREVLLGQRTL